MLRPSVNALVSRSAAVAAAQTSCPGVCTAGAERFGVRILERGVGSYRRGMMMMAAKPGKIKKGRSGKALDRKTVSLLKLLDAQAEPM